MDVDGLLDLLRERLIQARVDSEFIAATVGLAHPIELRIENESGSVGRLNGDEPTSDSIPVRMAGPAEVSTVRAGPSVGAVPAVSAGPAVLVLTAPAATWALIARELPPVGYHSFTAATRLAEGFTVSGTPLMQAQALHALERLFEILRGQIESPGPSMVNLSGVRGGYLSVEVQGRPIQIFYEEAGSPEAPALLMLHTAGADSRQYHAVMADRTLARDWRMLAFDLPGHGRSPPAASGMWQGYRLDGATYLQICCAVARGLASGPVTVMGCSMGAAMALLFAARHPALTAGVIGLEAPFRAAGRRTAMLANAAVNQAAHNPAYVRGLMGPGASLPDRRYAAWIYSQGGFQIYSGDLAFYSDEFDAERDLAGLSTARFGISLLTGAYDYSASPDDSRRVAALIEGARFVEMPELGHFPMVENPRVLLRYLEPELARLRAAWAASGTIT